MPIRPERHKPAEQIAKRHDVALTWGQGRGGRPWRRKRDAVLARDLYTCQVCSKISDELEVDHIKPKAHGGDDSMTNLRAICVPCHKIKTTQEGGRHTGGPVQLKKVL
ncbi:MAG TPA: HNH endonuclease [Pseudomonas xinjiangensis]|uniref:HNH endonuclease n=2 Tax=root TaxID=1 RepID=A0A7V1FQZ5_9GAMM|nr:HNH endonuclease [Halopseudomonas xinjiangensis]HEC47163.1 HNH endonuclease [Halopseudomonas xinjiangensis]